MSVAPFDSLNLGRGIGDTEESVAENHRRLAEAVGYNDVFEVSQVHGVRIRQVRNAEDPHEVRQEDGDALIARDPGVAIGVRTADCIPVLMAHPGSGAVAAVHAGWRGVEQGIAPAAVRALGVAPEELLAVAGPHIRGDHFEVGSDVAARLVASASSAHLRGDPVISTAGNPRVDLLAILRSQLAALGIRLVDAGGGTFGDPARFFSYRRDGKASGRHLSVIVAKKRPPGSSPP